MKGKQTQLKETQKGDNSFHKMLTFIGVCAILPL